MNYALSNSPHLIYQFPSRIVLRCIALNRNLKIPYVWASIICDFTY